MRVSRIMKRIIVGFLACASAAMAEVSVTFPVTDTVLRNLFTLTLDFTVDGSGNVTLDAQSTNGGASPQAVVNAWDGPAGTIADAAFHGTNFTLTAVAKVGGVVSTLLQTSGAGTQGLFVQGGNRIDKAGAEEIVWTYEGPGSLIINSVDYVNRAGTGDSNLTFLDSDTRTEFLLPGPPEPTEGTIDLVGAGFSLVAGQGFVVTTDDLKDDGTTPREAAAGAALFGISFDLDTTVAIATPANLSAIGVDSQVLLDWDDDGTGLLDFYTVYRGLASGTNNYVELTNVTASAYNDLDVSNGTTYYYAVTATDTNGVKSDFSFEASATPAEPSTAVILYQHLDASVAASVLKNGSGEVTGWVDQSAFGNDAVAETVAIQQNSEPLFPSASLSQSGLVGVDMRTNRAAIKLFTAADAAAIFNFTGDASTNSGLAFLVAVKADSVAEPTITRDLFIGNAATIAGFQIRYDGGPLKAFLGGQTFDPGYTVQPGDTLVVGLKYNASTGEAIFWNSKNDVYVTNTLAVAANLGDDDVRLGGSTNGDQFFDGMIGEVKVFSSTLSASEFDAQLEGLVNKWVGSPSFANWATQWGVDIGSETNDYDDNGLNNLYEYGLNGNPVNGTVDPAVLPEFTKTGSGFEYVHVQRNNDPALVYTVETTGNLAFPVWTNIGYTVSGTNVSGDVFDTVTNAIPTTETELFIRLNIEN